MGVTAAGAGAACPQTAKAYLLAHDQRVRDLDRMTSVALRAVRLNVLAERRIISVMGGPLSRDELIRDIAELEFPHADAARLNYHTSLAVYRPPSVYITPEDDHVTGRLVPRLRTAAASDVTV